MSIISEALKKAQDQNKQFQKKKTYPDSIIKADRPLTKTKKLWLAVFAIIVISSAFTGFGLIKNTTIDSGLQPAATDYEMPTPLQKEITVETVKTGEAPIQIEKDLYPKERLDAQSFELSGIVFGDGRPFAVINDSILEEGDKIGEGQVISIEKNKVTLLFGDEEVILTLK